MVFFRAGIYRVARFSLAAAGGFLSLPLLASDSPRTFFNKEGKQIEAQVVDVLPDSIVEVRGVADGTLYQIPILELSLEDQQFLADFVRMKEGGGASPPVLFFPDRLLSLETAIVGSLTLEGDHAFPLVSSEASSNDTVGAASLLKRGRVAAFSHSTFTADLVEKSPVARDLVLNTVRWLGDKRSPKVLLHGRSKGMAIALREAGFELVSATLEEITPETCDVVVLSGALVFPDSTISALRHYVEEGGSLLAGTTPWATQNKYANFAEEFPGNRIFSDSGISFLPRSLRDGKSLRILESNPVVVSAPGITEPSQ